VTGLLPQDQSWDDLLDPAADPAEAVEEVRRSLGIGVPRVRYGDGLPDVGELAGDIGLA
jgi:hypothetical protein